MLIIIYGTLEKDCIMIKLFCYHSYNGNASIVRARVSKSAKTMKLHISIANVVVRRLHVIVNLSFFHSLMQKESWRSFT